ncbi:hypothetical protein VP01_233g4 [Puccinia sorghi]|uniref:Uncharacterized protein n=1 Tax=Puccinia sorghi TaxID=27349 RepID=A0A0L6V998_9BASI|nr:hypothetical protein VP01_233g4 [Puccinia sorghi]
MEVIWKLFSSFAFFFFESNSEQTHSRRVLGLVSSRSRSAASKSRSTSNKSLCERTLDPIVNNIGPDSFWQGQGHSPHYVSGNLTHLILPCLPLPDKCSNVIQIAINGSLPITENPKSGPHVSKSQTLVDGLGRINFGIGDNRKTSNISLILHIHKYLGLIWPAQLLWYTYIYVLGVTVCVFRSKDHTHQTLDGVSPSDKYTHIGFSGQIQHILPKLKQSFPRRSKLSTPFELFPIVFLFNFEVYPTVIASQKYVFPGHQTFIVAFSMNNNKNKLLIFMSHDSCHVWITWDLIAWYIVSYLCEQPIMTWKNTDIFLFEKFIFNFPDSNCSQFLICELILSTGIKFNWILEDECLLIEDIFQFGLDSGNNSQCFKLLMNPKNWNRLYNYQPQYSDLKFFFDQASFLNGLWYTSSLDGHELRWGSGLVQHVFMIFNVNMVNTSWNKDCMNLWRYIWLRGMDLKDSVHHVAIEGELNLAILSIVWPCQANRRCGILRVHFFFPWADTDLWVFLSNTWLQPKLTTFGRKVIHNLRYHGHVSSTEKLGIHFFFDLGMFWILNMEFTYVMPGWEGSAHNGRLWDAARFRFSYRSLKVYLIIFDLAGLKITRKFKN